jgi:hypothetical protein
MRALREIVHDSYLPQACLAGQSDPRAQELLRHDSFFLRLHERRSDRFYGGLGCLIVLGVRTAGEIVMFWPLGVSVATAGTDTRRLD